MPEKVSADWAIHGAHQRYTRRSQRRSRKFRKPVEAITATRAAGTPDGLRSNLRIHFKKGFHGLAEGCLDFFLAAFDQVHGHASATPIFQNHGGVAYLAKIVFGQKTHPVNQR